MLSFENVYKEFKLDEETTISPVRNVTLDVEPGEFVIIVGRSGTGKTTLLNLAAGLVKPTSGRVMLDGADLKLMGQKQLSSVRNQKIGFIFQFPSLLPSLTVIENVTLPAIFTGSGDKNSVNAMAKQLLQSFGLSDKVDVYPRQLSAGESKRVVVARSLINQPRLVIADEPTSDLDERTENEVMAILHEANCKGITFLMVTHSTNLKSFATRTFEMSNGTLKPC